jgi:hypothetical protein
MREAVPSGAWVAACRVTSWSCAWSLGRRRGFPVPGSAFAVAGRGCRRHHQRQGGPPWIQCRRAWSDPWPAPVPGCSSRSPQPVQARQRHYGPGHSVGRHIDALPRHRRAVAVGRPAPHLPRYCTSASDWVKNGDRWTVLTTHRDGGLRVQHRRSGRTIQLLTSDVRDFVELGYATTSPPLAGLMGTSSGLACSAVSSATSCDDQLTGAGPARSSALISSLASYAADLVGERAIPVYRRSTRPAWQTTPPKRPHPSPCGAPRPRSTSCR